MLHAKALHGNPFDGCALGSVVVELELTARDPSHPCRQAPPRSRGLLRATTPVMPRHRPNPSRCVAGRRRAGHWAHEGRASDGLVITTADATAIAVTPRLPLPATTRLPPALAEE